MPTFTGTAGSDNLTGTASADQINGLAGDDTITGGAGADTLTGGDGTDTFAGSAADMNGDTITDFAIGDWILIDDVSYANFTYSVSGNTLSYTGGTLSFSAPLTAQLNVTAYGGTGVRLYLTVYQFNGTLAADTLTGTQWDDRISGNTGNDILYGRAGNDLLMGDDGNDQVYGEAGDDMIVAGFGNDSYDGGTGSDTVAYNMWGWGVNVSLGIAGPQDLGNWGIDTLTGIENLIGSQSADVLTGDNNANSIDGGATGSGALDTIRGAGGNDHLTGFGFLIGGDGNDTLTVRSQAVIEFHAGDDQDDIWNLAWGSQIQIYDYAAARSIVQVGDAVVLTLSDTDVMTFHGVSVELVQSLLLFMNSSGDGTIRGGPNSDTLSGGAEDNAIFGYGNPDYLLGNGGNDYLSGGDADDSLNGGAGDDILEGDAGQDTLYGGDGVDMASYANATAGVQVSLALRNPQNTVGAGFDNLVDVIENLGGSAYDDVLTGDELANAIYGNGGNDQLHGGAGNDTLEGGAGNDQLWGAQNDDLLRGDGGDDRLYGGDGNDQLVGGAGSDVLDGGAGDDLYIVDSLDTVVELSGGGIDTVRTDGSSFSLAGQNNVENLTGTGNADQLLIGSSDDNRIDGGLGADRMEGGLGNDVYVVDQTGDRVVEAIGAGTDTVVSAIGVSLQSWSDELENLTLTGLANLVGNGNDLANILTGNAGANILRGFDGADSLYGQDGNDRLEGGNGADLLFGDVGNDWLSGGSGNDSLTGGAGADTFHFGAPLQSNVDHIADLVAGDRIELSVSIFSALPLGALGATAFRQGTAASSTQHRIIYNNVTGQLFYDADGTGAIAAILFATVSIGTSVSAATFSIVAAPPSTITSAASYTLGANEGNLFLTGSAAIDGTGNALDNEISGNGEANRLSGGAGIDTLTGGTGTDTFVDTRSGLSGDTITDLATGDRIILTDATPAGFTFSLSGSTLTFTGGSLTLTGFTGTLTASAASGGGVQLTAGAAATINDVRNDFNGDGRSDILWRNVDGQMSNWLGQASGGFVQNNANAAAVVPLDWQIAATGDFNGDGRDDILWRNVDGQISNWLATAAGGYTPNNANAAAVVPTAWHVLGTGDFNGDGRDDILWRHDDGTISNWLGTAAGGYTANDSNAAAPVPTAWHVAGIADFNGDGRDDILWRNDDGQMSNWLGTATGGFTPNNANAAAVVPIAWTVIGSGDFNGDGRDDILWRHTDGTISNWLGTATGGYTPNDANAAVVVPLAWSVVAIGDYNGDGRDDILWRHTDGTLSNWLGTATGGYTPNDTNAATPVPISWEVQPEPFWL